ncbi:MAG: hypothetical protein KAU31_03945, partial [Spirochaetaceae bacterium]|nr:hypothetical protein [Spirochaetaceae bacterium]
DDRVSSLAVRLVQEDLFGARALERPLFGWGGWGRGWPVDPRTGERLVSAVDSLFIIVYSASGWFGLLSLFGAVSIGAWGVLGRLGRRPKTDRAEEDNAYTVDLVVLSLVVVFFMVDALLNAMINQIYILCAGALVSHHISVRRASLRAQCVVPDRLR